MSEHKPFGELRPLRKDDARQVLDWRNGEHVRKFMATQETIPWENHVKWIDKVTTDIENYAYFIYEAEGKPLGLIGFYGFENGGKTAEWGLYIGEPDAPKGAGESMCRIALDKFFLEMGGEELHTYALAQNIKAISLYEKLGFEPFEKGQENECYMRIKRAS